MNTESRNDASVNLDQMSPAEIVDLMASEDQQCIKAVLAAKNEIVRAIEAVATAYDSGGSVIYAGAGTSGRIAAMEAVELVPTFGVDPNRFLALMAGGAYTKPSEGAEDDRLQARADFDRMVSRIVPGGDSRGFAVANVEPGRIRRAEHLVVGVSASGKTPYVLEVISGAKHANMRTIGIANNPGAQLLSEVDIPIFLDTGPEVLTGSTRLKAGTAQKMSLNMISVGAMSRCGRVKSNLMTNLQPVSDKLKLRAIQIVTAQLHVSADEARERLEAANWRLQAVISTTVS